MKHKLVNPFPMEVSDRLINLLDHWFEWRHKKGSPRSVHLPEETYRWRMEKGHLIAEPGFCLEVSTAPRDPGKMWEFNLSYAVHQGSHQGLGLQAGVCPDPGINTACHRAEYPRRPAGCTGRSLATSGRLTRSVNQASTSRPGRFTGWENAAGRAGDYASIIA